MHFFPFHAPLLQHVITVCNSTVFWTESTLACDYPFLAWFPQPVLRITFNRLPFENFRRDSCLSRYCLSLMVCNSYDNSVCNFSFLPVFTCHSVWCWATVLSVTFSAYLCLMMLSLILPPFQSPNLHNGFLWNGCLRVLLLCLSILSVGDCCQPSSPLQTSLPVSTSQFSAEQL